MKLATILLVVLVVNCTGCSSPSKKDVAEAILRSSELCTDFEAYFEQVVWKLSFTDEKRIPQVIAPRAQAITDSLKIIQRDWRAKGYKGNSQAMVDSLIEAYISYIDNTQLYVRIHYGLSMDGSDKQEVAKNVKAAKFLAEMYTAELNKKYDFSQNP